MQAPRGFESLPLRHRRARRGVFLVRVSGRGRELKGMARWRGREFKCGREFNLRGGAVFWCVCWGVGANLDLLIFVLQFPRACFKVIETCTNLEG